MSTISAEHESTGSMKKSQLWEWTKAIVVALVCIYLIQSFLFSPFLIKGSSMYPSFKNNERVIINSLIYHFNKPKHGDVVVVHTPVKRKFIKRIIALPGESVQIRDNKVYVSGREIKESYILERIEESRNNGLVFNHDFEEIIVPEGHVFVMGDNRLNSQDSRDFGAIPINDIIGRVDVKLWPSLQFTQHY